MKINYLELAFIFLICSFVFAGVMIFFKLEPSLLHLTLSSIIAVAVTYYVFEIQYKSEDGPREK